MFRLYFTLFIVIFASLSVWAEPKFDIEIPLPGESIASKQLQYDTLFAVLPCAGRYNKKCQSFSILDTKLVHNIKDGVIKDNRYVEGYWQEIWTVKRCSQQVDVPITFVLDGKGGTYYQVSDSEVILRKPSK